MGAPRIILQLVSSMLCQSTFFTGKLYKPEGNFVDERHRHRYEVNPKKVHLFVEKGFVFVGKDTEGVRMEIMELQGMRLAMIVRLS